MEEVNVYSRSGLLLLLIVHFRLLLIINRALKSRVFTLPVKKLEAIFER